MQTKAYSGWQIANSKEHMANGEWLIANSREAIEYRNSEQSGKKRRDDQVLQ
jgi:hypothetical protein